MSTYCHHRVSHDLPLCPVAPSWKQFCLRHSSGLIIKVKTLSRDQVPERCQNFTPAKCGLKPPCRECLRVSVCVFLTLVSSPSQAPAPIATPPSTASAPAGRGAAPARWCRDPAPRCSTACVTTQPVSCKTQIGFDPAHFTHPATNPAIRPPRGHLEGARGTHGYRTATCAHAGMQIVQGEDKRGSRSVV